MLEHPFPLILGILNVTPDSFYDQGRYFSFENLQKRAQQICEEGAHIIEIGGASSRPGASPVSEEEELQRVMTAIDAVKDILTIPFSIDSCSPKIVEEALKRGATLINDIRGFDQPEMISIAANNQVDICVMHSLGVPQMMQLNPCYPEGVVKHILHFFERRIQELIQAGIKKSQIILDPGIGFGKSVEHNLAILKAIPLFKQLGCRLMIGASRKGFLTKILNKPATELLPATLVIHTMSLILGADIIRVHDVKEHKDMMNVISAFKTLSKVM